MKESGGKDCSRWPRTLLYQLKSSPSRPIAPAIADTTRNPAACASPNCFYSSSGDSYDSEKAMRYAESEGVGVFHVKRLDDLRKTRGRNGPTWGVQGPSITCEGGPGRRGC